MNSNYIERHLLVDRYLQGKLEESEQAVFEERLMWDQSLLEDVQLAERLRDGLKAASAAQPAVERTPGFNLVATLSGLFSVPQYAAAASFLLAVTLTVGVLTSPLVNPGGQSGAPALQTDIVPVFATRSDDAVNVAVDRGAWTVLLVDVVGDYARYRVTVRPDEPGADPVWMQDGLMPTYPESLAVGMPGSALPTGQYVLTIEGAMRSDAADNSYEHVQDIPFVSTPAD